MEPLEIAEKLKREFANEVVDISEFRGQVSVTVKRERILDICRFLKSASEIEMDYLADLCGVDYPERRFRFEVVYNLYSIPHRHAIRLKALLPGDAPTIESVTPIWKGAEWHEREAYDMFGIVFNSHPDHRRILMPDTWDGYPLRKDYPLKGRDTSDYKEFNEAKLLHTHDDEWNIDSSF
ncbi:MAG: NADH-quinone oxidoreductase subunit C [Nitrospirae bacterium]|nr:NADH-quinone oxidoreductase subunit C [Nitrospirota bacterium]